MKDCFSTWTFFLTMAFHCCKGASDFDIAAKVLTALDLKQLTIIDIDGTFITWNGVRLAKTTLNKKCCFLVISSTTFQNKVGHSHPLFMFAKDSPSLNLSLDLIDKMDLGTQMPLIALLGSGVSERTIQSLGTTVRMNQQVYFVTASDLEIREAYSIGIIKLSKVIGEFVETEHGHYELSLDIDLSTDLGHRRNNLFGHAIKALVGQDPTYSYIRPGLERQDNFDSELELYRADNFVNGLYIDVLNTLSKEVNFTYKTFAHSEQIESWGTVINNKVTGLVRYIVNGTVDMTATPGSFTAARHTVLNYLPTIGAKIPSIFIKNNLGQDLSWSTFFKPFSIPLWMTLFSMALGIAGCLLLANFNPQDNKITHVTNYLGWVWMALSANAGGKPKDPFPKSGYNQLIVFICLLSGSVIWMAYRASITSELAAYKDSFPFDSLETLLKTNFKLGTEPRTSSTAQVFLKASKGSSYNKLLENHMTTEDSFVDFKTGLELVVSQEKYAYYADKQLILDGFPEYECKIVTAWNSKSALAPFAMMMSKTSPYYFTLKFAMLKYRDNGMIEQGLRQVIKKDPDCKPLHRQVIPLGFSKMIFLFSWLMGGIVVSGLILATEVQSQRRHRQVKEVRSIQHRVTKQDRQDLLKLISKLDDVTTTEIRHMTLKEIFNLATDISITLQKN